MNAFLKPLISVFRAVIRFSLHTFPFSFFIHFSLFQWLRDLFGHLILKELSSPNAQVLCSPRASSSSVFSSTFGSAVPLPVGSEASGTSMHTSRGWVGSSRAEPRFRREVPKGSLGSGAKIRDPLLRALPELATFEEGFIPYPFRNLLAGGHDSCIVASLSRHFRKGSL